MRKNYLLIFLILSIFHTNAQEFYLTSGINLTSYDYTSSNESHKNLDFTSGIGNSTEVGYKHRFEGNRFIYSVGMAYNEFNAKASNYATYYSWKTRYIGVLNKLSYNFSNRAAIYYLGIDINILFNIGISASKLADGDQYINTFYYDLLKHEDFSGTLIQPFVGFSAQYMATRTIQLILGYNFSKTFKHPNRTDEKVSFNTSQFQFGCQVTLF